MRRLRSSYAMTPVVFSVAVCVPLSAQNLGDDPRSVAATCALEEDGFTGRGTRLVVDSVRGAVINDVREGRWLPGSERQNRRALASTPGARIGTLQTYFECPLEPIRPSGRRLTMHHGCRLTDGVEAVVQIDPPQATDDGFEIAVTTWSFIPHPREDVWVLTSTHREMRLRKDLSGELTVTVLSVGIGHW